MGNRQNRKLDLSEYFGNDTYLVIEDDGGFNNFDIPSKITMVQGKTNYESSVMIEDSYRGSYLGEHLAL